MRSEMRTGAAMSFSSGGYVSALKQSFTRASIASARGSQKVMSMAMIDGRGVFVHIGIESHERQGPS
jgi:hypothetical protein